ncbi:MAG: PEP-CTERM sorting domain-containing protein [Phycisphaerae bacterium]|nr:PEP-CTERM sorting domain-containing protein [Phycisphaerae bacterium]
MSSMRSLVAVVFGSVLIAASITAIAHPPGFDPLGDLPGNRFLSEAFGISKDADSVVGTSIAANGYLRAFRWQEGAGMSGLGVPIPGNYRESIAYATNADGSVAVGYAFNSTGGLPFEAPFRWTPGGGMQLLSGIPANTIYGVAYDTSFSGNVVAGSLTGYLIPGNTTPVTRGFRWLTTTGFTLIPPLGNCYSDSEARGVSSNGSVVVGGTYNANCDYEAFRWTPAGGTVGLGDLPGNFFSSKALGTNSNGSVVVGRGTGVNGFEAFRWTSSGGMSGLGRLPGNQYSYANATSDAGNVVVGYCTPPNQSGLSTAFIWYEGRGMFTVHDLLHRRGIHDADGWLLLEATDVDADGALIVGYGINPSGAWEGWRASIPVCFADFNADHSVDDFDYFDFLNAFNLNAPEADYNQDGNVDDFDYFDFLNDFFAGC